MKLYAVTMRNNMWRKDNTVSAVEVTEVAILKETEKQYTVGRNPLSRAVITKKELGVLNTTYGTPSIVCAEGGLQDALTKLRVHYTEKVTNLIEKLQRAELDLAAIETCLREGRIRA